MDIEKVIDWFGSVQKTADALGVTYQSVHQWRKVGRIPPTREWQIVVLTHGAIPRSTSVDQNAKQASA